MKTIRKIFLTDLKNLSRNLFALIIAIGICFLPALYAWCNIYSNWDPYGNTGSLKLAAVSLDKGYTDAEGNDVNMGDTIISQLEENDAVDWQFVDSEDAALAGVNSGDYYAAVVIDEDFSYNMYNVFTTDFEKPTLTFYENQKKNPVAAKISDTVVSTLESSINEQFIKVMASTVFSQANMVSEDMQEEGGVDGLIEKISSINNELIEYEKIIDSVITSNSILTTTISGSEDDVNALKDKAASSSTSLKDAENSLSNTQVTLNTYSEQVNLTLDTMETSLNNISKEIQEAQLSKDINDMATASANAYDDTTQLLTDLNALYTSLSNTGATGADLEAIKAALGTLSGMQGSVEDLQKILQSIDAQAAAQAAGKAATASEQDLIDSLTTASKDVTNLQNTYNNNLVPQMNNSIDSLEDVLSNASDLMSSMSSTLANMGDVFGALQTTVSCTNTSLEKTRDALEAISNKLTDALDKVQGVSDDEKVQMLIDTLSGNPDLYGEFFSEPVEIETEAVYPIENYGSAVTPFYTVLAIWVGGIILTAIIKVNPNEKKYPNAKPYEMFFGRYALFFFLAEIQTLITVLGDLYILKVQCLHPFLFWLASAIASLAFSILIYALVVAFGDVGKAASVVIVVLQIAGSSGTYPIELLPEFFQKVYIFFPFPYAINAMRETICGMYESDYVIYLLELSVFVIVGLVIGLLIRKPFMELNEYMEKRMEDTEMM